MMKRHRWETRSNSPDQSKARKTWPSRPLSQAQDSANMVSKASARTAPMRARVKGTEIPVHPACRMGHMRLPCLARDRSPRTRCAYSSKTRVRAKHYSSVIPHSPDNYWDCGTRTLTRSGSRCDRHPDLPTSRNLPSIPIADMRMQPARAISRHHVRPLCSNDFPP